MQACPNDRINTSYNCGQAWIALFNKRMKEFSVFDIIGPRMVGPSSSHTAGAVRIGLVAHRIARGKINSAEITLYGSFAQTGRGHGTDRAVIAGILGVEPDDARVKHSMLLAKSESVDIKVNYSSDGSSEHRKDSFCYRSRARILAGWRQHRRWEH